MILKLGMKYEREELYKGYINHANGLKTYVYENILTPGGYLSQPRGNIHAYDHNIQTYYSLKPLAQSKLNFMWSIVRKGG